MTIYLATGIDRNATNIGKGKLMSKKVFLVTDGSYSDYGVCAVFSDEGQANEFARLGGFERVEEYLIHI